MMAVLDPVKVIIDNYPEGQVEYLEVDNNVENPELGKEKGSFHQRALCGERGLHGGATEEVFPYVPWQ